MGNNRGNSLAEFAVTMALMATLASTAAPAFSRIGEGAKAKQTKRNMETIMKASSTYYNTQLELSGMGKFPGQPHRTSNVGIVTDDGDRRISEQEISEGTFVSVWADTNFLHLFDNDTIKSPYQEGGYHYAVIAGTGTGNDIQAPIFIIVDEENEEDFYRYFKP